MFLSLGVLLVEHKIVAYVNDDASIAAEGLSLKQFFVPFGADFCLVSTFLYGKTQKIQRIFGIFANYDYLCT